MNINNKDLLNKSEGFFLIVYVVLLIAFSYFLFSQYINNSPALIYFSSILWIIFCIVEIFINWRKLTNEKLKNELVKEKTNLPFSTKWSLERLPGTIAIFVLCIPLVVILAIVLTNNDLANIQLVSKPEFENLEIWSSILLAMGLIVQDTEKLFEFKQKFVKQILTLFNIVFVGFGFILYLIYAINLTEVSS